MSGQRCQMNMRFDYSPDYAPLNLSRKLGDWTVRTGTASEEISLLYDVNGYLTKMPSGVTVMQSGAAIYDLTAAGPEGASRLIFDYDGTGTCILSGDVNCTLTLNSTVGNKRTYTMTAPVLDTADRTAFQVRISAITFGDHPRNFRIYLEKYATEVAAGQLCHPKFIEFHGVPSVTRYMEAQRINGSIGTRWIDRNPESAMSWTAGRFKPDYWIGACTHTGKNKYVSSSTVAGNPSSWVHGQIVHLRITDTDVIVPIQAITKGATTSIQANSHGIVDSEYIRFDPSTIYSNLRNVIALATRVDDDNFTIPVDSTGYPSFVSGNFYFLHTLTTTTLPEVTMSSQHGAQFFSGDITAGAVRTFAYDAVLNQLIMEGGGSNNGGLPSGIPFEMSLDISAELGKEAWICIPLNFDDDAVTNLAILCRDRNPTLKIHIELSNEVWNTAAAFGQTNWSNFKAKAQWPALTSHFYNNWYGKRYQEVMEIFTTVFAATGQTSRLTRWFGVWLNDSPSSNKTNRIDSPQHFADTGKKAATYIDGICPAQYFDGGLTANEWLEWGYKYSLGGSNATDALAFLNGRTTGDTGSHPFSILGCNNYLAGWVALAATFTNDKGLHPIVGDYEGGDQNTYSGAGGTYLGNFVTPAMVFDLIKASRQTYGYIWYKKYFDGHIAAGGSLPSQYAGVGSFYSVTNPWSLKDNLFRFVNEPAWNFIVEWESDVIFLPTHGGGAAQTRTRDQKANEKRKQRLREIEIDIESTIRQAYQRLTGKTTEPPILKQESTPQKLAVHAEKLAAQLVEKSKNSAKQRTHNKEIIQDLQRQAAAIMQEEEEAIVMLLH